jgi:hypothetical protein
MMMMLMLINAGADADELLPSAPLLRGLGEEDMPECALLLLA